MRLLSDLREVFGESDALHGETILNGLHKIPEAPWGDYFGKPLNARGLAKLLRPYGIRSRDVWIADQNRKGYRREDLWDAWQRYLPPVGGGSARSARSANEQVSEPRMPKQETLGPLEDAEPSPPSASSGPSGEAVPSGPSEDAQDSASSLSRELAHLAHLADTPPEPVHTGLCEACGELEDSTFHAMQCLGEDASRPVGMRTAGTRTRGDASARTWPHDQQAQARDRRPARWPRRRGRADRVAARRADQARDLRAAGVASCRTSSPAGAAASAACPGTCRPCGERPGCRDP